MEGQIAIRRAILKKRTVPLFSENILKDLSSEPIQIPEPQSSLKSLPISSAKDKKEKKRERWLLTRKTWKYMADAGRKIIPDGAQSRPEDIQKCEKHFQNICANEPRYILWRRKTSYPGALGASRKSKRRLRLLLSHSHKAINVNFETEETQNADQIVDLLQRFLKLDESQKITTLLGSKTVRPDQTSSPSSQRPSGVNRVIGCKEMSSRGPGFLPPLDQTPKGIYALSEIDQLLERLRTLSRSATCCIKIPLEQITPELLEDKTLLKQIYNELKKQQLHRIIGKLSNSCTGSQRSLNHSSSLSSLWYFRRDGSAKSTPAAEPSFTSQYYFNPCTNKSCPPSTFKTQDPLSSALNPLPMISIKQPSAELFYSSVGTQTCFIQLHDIERLANSYKDMKKNKAAALAASSLGQANDDESDIGATESQCHLRKSSIDNEDVSQSVSDTIKRYLRMARRKSVSNDNTDRFKRVNYDRFIRNIKANGEINPPGIDDGNSKATQTLDAWPVIFLEYIRGHYNTNVLEEAHLEWTKSLEQRLQQKQYYDAKLKQKQMFLNHEKQKESVDKIKTSSQYQTHLGPSLSAPTSPTNVSKSQGHGGIEQTASGILHSSTQFLSNLWHGNPANTTCSLTSVEITAAGYSNSSNAKNLTSTMQKSKSSSNVGQFVSKKIFKTRSKSQTRTPTPTKAEWTPKGNCAWTSDNGRHVTLSNVHLQSLTEVETKILQKVAIEKIKQLNIGVSLSALSDNNNNTQLQKRRPLAKKKAMTTSFFDIGRKDDKASSLGIFGNTLENCVANDQKRRMNLIAASERGSRSSLTSLFRSGAGSKVHSCESLPSDAFSLPHFNSNLNNFKNGSSVDRGGGQSDGNLVKIAAMPISCSQSDIRNSNKNFEDWNSSELSTEMKVPTFVQECIRYLETYGLHSVGIFRVSTSRKRVRQMREEFDKRLSTSIDIDTCPHDVATLLKEFLRDLPDPLLCRHLYKAFIQTQKIRNRRLQLETLSHLVQLLPAAHRDTLFVLLRFLAKVASCCDDITAPEGNITGNKMDTYNLATVFAPNILRSSLPGEENFEQESMGDVINVIRTMIDHYEELFRVPADLLDEIYANMIDTFPEQLNYLCERRNVLENDELDKGGFHTPAFSPPLNEVIETPSKTSLKQKFNEKPHMYGGTRCESSPTCSPSFDAQRKLYTRNEVMHKNAVSKGDPPQEGSRRSSTGNSLAKYEIISDYLNTPKKTLGKVYSHSMHQQGPKVVSDTNPNDTVLTRHLSSPHIFDQTGVLTASLKIPVQMQPTGSSGGTSFGSSNTQDLDDEDEVFYRSTQKINISNIPYIEDSANVSNFEHCTEGYSMTGSFSLDNGLDGKNATNISGKDLNIGQLRRQYKDASSNNKYPGNSEGNQAKPQCLVGAAGSNANPYKLTTFLSNSGNVTASSPSEPFSKPEKRISCSTKKEKTAMQPSIKPQNTCNSPEAKSHREQLPSTSISNIGGAIMRSKTADFEKLSAVLPCSSAQRLRIETTPTKCPRGTLYKRQELISSAKKTSKH